jgi:hypothetical protein
MLALAFPGGSRCASAGARAREYSLCIHCREDGAPSRRVPGPGISTGFFHAADSTHGPHRRHVCDIERGRGEQAASSLQIDLPSLRQPLLPFSNLGERPIRVEGNSRHPKRRNNKDCWHATKRPTRSRLLPASSHPSPSALSHSRQQPRGNPQQHPPDSRGPLY